MFCQFINTDLTQYFPIINRHSSTQSETTDDEGIPDNVPKPGKQRKCDPEMWDSIPVTEVEKLTEGIEGLVKYNIVNAKTSKEISSAQLADGRKWKKSNVTQWKNKGEMRYSDCKGSFRCINTQCPFRVQFGVTNTRQFKNGSNNDQACSVCGDAGEFVACTARRYVKYGKKGRTGVALWEPHVPRNIKAGETNGTCEGDDKETSSLEAGRNTVCLCSVIVAD